MGFGGSGGGCSDDGDGGCGDDGGEDGGCGHRWSAFVGSLDCPISIGSLPDEVQRR